MKKIILSLMFSVAAFLGANAMSFERAQAEALYLTDKMAYELNLNDQQYNDAYEINLDYFLSIGSPSDLYGSYYRYRLNDLRCILYDWQYTLLTAADYFLRPIVWRAGGWFFPVYAHYNRGFFYYSYPSIWATYRGGHGRYYHHAGFYGNRRPVWNGGMRGHDMHRPSPGMGGRVGGRPGAGRSVAGRGYHFNVGGHRGSGMSHQQPGSGRNGGVSSGNHGNGMNSGGHGSGMNSGGHGSGMNSGGHNSGSRGGSMNPSGSMSHGGSSHSGIGRGNSFDGSSSRMGGGSRGGGFSGGSRGGSPSFGGNRGGGSSRGGGFSGGSRGGSPSFGGNRGGGSSRGGRR